MSLYNVRWKRLRFRCGPTQSPVREYRLALTNNWIVPASIELGTQMGGGRTYGRQPPVGRVPRNAAPPHQEALRRRRR